MSDNSGITWTDATWNPLTGCKKVSPGCDRCYAIVNANIRSRHPNEKVAAAYEGLVERGPDGALDWTGRINLLPERLDQPLRWRRPRRIFVNAQSDLFHDAVPDEFLVRVFDVMQNAGRHTFQVLTKRHARMRSFVTRYLSGGFVTDWSRGPLGATVDRPPKNIWLGVSVEDQRWARVRLRELQETPAAVRWVSCEPLLGPLDLSRWLGERIASQATAEVAVRHGTKSDEYTDRLRLYFEDRGRPALDWIVVGGESGSGARRMAPEWATSLRDQCAAAGVPFLFKQTGTVLAREWGIRGKGEDPAEWPEPFAQEYPAAAA